MEKRAQPDIAGRSKRIWIEDGGTCFVEIVESLRSFTFNREEIVADTGKPRLDFYELAAAKLADAGVRTAFLHRCGDMTYRALYRPAPPFEVIVKNVATGSTTRKYPGLFPEGFRFARPIVKFDYRTDPEDQPIGEDYLRLYGVPVEDFRAVALRTNEVLRDWLAPLDLWDFCLVIAKDGDGQPVIVSEISPDCMRLRSPDGAPLDKDLFRRGVKPEVIVAQWQELIDVVRERA